MRVYLCFLKMSQNSLSLSYCAFFLILHRVQSAEFCEIVIGLNQNLGYYFIVVVFWSFGLLSLLMDEMLIHFSLIFDRWMTTPTPSSEPTDGSCATCCTALVFPPCSGTCCTALATRGLQHTMVAHTVSSGFGVARSTWISRLTPLTRP
jgi:hypothetical protein